MAPLQRLTAYGLLASGMALFGSATPVSKIVGAAFPSMVASGMRMAVAAVVLLPFVALATLRDAVATLDRADRLRLLAIALIGTFGFTLLLLYGLRLTTGAVASIVMATTPAVAAVGAAVFLGERLDRSTGIAVGLAVLGVGAVNLGGASGVDGRAVVWLGSLLVFAAVCCEAAYTLLGKRLGADLQPSTIALVAAALAGVAFAPLAAWQAVGFDWSEPSWSDWLAVAWWGAGTMGLGSVLWFAGVRRVSGTTASGFMAVMPVSALVLSYVLLREPFAVLHAVGIAIVLSAIAILTYREATVADRTEARR